MNIISMPTPAPYGIGEEAAKAGLSIIWADGKYLGSEGAQDFVDAYDPLPIVKRDKLAALADLRWHCETRGTIVNGVLIATDDRAKVLLAGKRLEAMARPESEWAWKIGPGQTVTLTAAQIIGLSDAVAAHVQGCFDREAAIAAQILALTDWQDVASFDVAEAWGTAP